MKNQNTSTNKNILGVFFLALSQDLIYFIERFIALYFCMHWLIVPIVSSFMTIGHITTAMIACMIIIIGTLYFVSPMFMNRANDKIEKMIEQHENCSIDLTSFQGNAIRIALNIGVSISATLFLICQMFVVSLFI